MNLISYTKNLLKRKVPVTKTVYAEFWEWFNEHQKSFTKNIRLDSNLKKEVFDVINPMLKEIYTSISCSFSMYDIKTIEITFSALGDIKAVPTIENLVISAPEIAGWKFTAFYQPTESDDFGITTGSVTFDYSNLFFCVNNDSNLHDHIDLFIMHKDFLGGNDSSYRRGIYTFLNNYLGELNVMTLIDSLSIEAYNTDKFKVIPIQKLKSYLQWRKSEFQQEYGYLEYVNPNDNYTSLDAELMNGMPYSAIVNVDLLSWIGKASHPWIVILEIRYISKTNGFPNLESCDCLKILEEELLNTLSPIDGYQHIGHQTGNGLRTVYFVCNDFRKPVIVLNKILKQPNISLDLEYVIFKDKYWTFFDSLFPTIAF